MSTPPSIAAIDAQAPVQQRIWRVSRIMWWAMALTLALAGAGLFGEGPLATRRVQARDGSLQVTYDRFQRADAASLFVLRVSRRQADGNVVLCLDRAFLDIWQPNRMEPAPVREEAQGADVCYVTLVPAEAPDPTIRLWANARTGRLSATGTLRVPGGDSIRLHALVWP